VSQSGLHFSERLQTPYLTGVIFQFLADFWTIFGFSPIFGVHFSGFCRFYDFQTRYTRAEDGTLMYSPSENRVEAGQLGP
jgi:hypothetical protein